MAGQNIIDFGFDVDKFSEQQKHIMTELTQVYNMATKLDGLRVGSGQAQGYADMNKIIKEQEDAIKRLSDQIDKLTKKREDDKKKTEEQKITEQVIAADRKKRMKEEISNTLDLGDAYDKLERQYKNAAKEAKKLAAEYGAGSEQAKKASANALELSTKLKKIDESVGQTNRNVGNYKVAIREAFEETGLLGTVGGQKIMLLENAFGMVKKGVGAVGNAFSTLKGALIASGIGAIIIGLSSLYAWMEKTKEGSLTLAKTMGGLKGVWEGLGGEFANMFTGKGDGINGLSAKMAMWYGMGQEIAIQQKKIAADERIELVKNSVLNKEIAELKIKALGATLNLEQKTELLTKANEKAEQLEENKLEHAKEELKHVQTQLALKLTAGIYDRELLQKEAEAKAHLNDIEAESAMSRRRLQSALQNDIKQLREEETNYKIALLKQEADAVIDTNDKIIANEHSTQKQKIEAQRSTLSEQLKLIVEEREAKLDDPSLTHTKRMTIIEESNTEYEKAIRDSNEKVRKLNEEYANRDIVATTAIEKNKLDLKRDAIANELKEDQLRYESRISYEHRAELLQRSVQIDIQEENDTFNKNMKVQAGKTQKEIEAMTDEHNRRLALITTKGELDLIAIQKEYYQKSIKDIQGAQLKTENTQLDDYNIKLKSLYENLSKGTISFGQFNEAKEKLESGSAIESLNSQISTQRQLKEQAIRAKDYDSADKFEKQILELTKQRTERQIELEQKAFNKKKALQEKEIELAQKSAELAHAFLNRNIENEKNANAEKLNQIETSKEAAIKSIEESTMSEEQKAAAIKKINLQAQADKEAIAMRQKKLDQEKARNDKLIAVFNIILNTAVGITKALAEANIPLAIVVGALGAVELATALATPVPKYATGREGGKGEWALTDEKGPELYIRKSGEMFLGSNKGPNLKYIEPGMTIKPADEVNDYLMRAMMNSQFIDIPERRDNTGQKIDNLTNMIAWQTGELKRAYGKNKTNVTVNISGMTDYVKQQIYH